MGRGEQPTCPTPVLSVSYYIEFDINYPDHLFPMAGFIPIFIDKEMVGQRVEMIWPESGSKKWSEPEFDLGDLMQDSLPTLFTDLGNSDTRKGVMDILVLVLQIHTHDENTACLLLRELPTLSLVRGIEFRASHIYWVSVLLLSCILAFICLFGPRLMYSRLMSNTL